MVTDATHRVAAVQMNPRLGATESNLESMAQRTAEAAAGGADIVLFPECALQGIVFPSPEAALEAAEPGDGQPIRALGELSREHDFVESTS